MTNDEKISIIEKYINIRPGSTWCGLYHLENDAVKFIGYELRVDPISGDIRDNHRVDPNRVPCVEDVEADELLAAAIFSDTTDSSKLNRLYLEMITVSKKLHVLSEMREHYELKLSSDFVIARVHEGILAINNIVDNINLINSQCNTH